MPFPNRCALLLTALLLFPVQAQAATENGGFFQMVSFYFENDAFAGTDYHYTNGIKIALTSADLESHHNDNMPGFWPHCLGGGLPLVGRADLKRSFSLAIGQSMYTPEDKDSNELIEDDRPYAGVTYLEMGISGQNHQKINTWKFVLGITGPHSYAEDVQKTVHKWLDWDMPAGWEHQINDEPVINLFFNQRRRIALGSPVSHWGWDAIPAWGFGLGNLYTGAQAGVQVRFGWNLPKDFGAGPIRSGAIASLPLNEKGDVVLNIPDNTGMHLFAGAEGQYCLADLTLDGNTFRDSHSVGKEPFVVTAMAGLGFTINKFKLSFAYIYRGKEFKDQNKADEYGSVSINYIF